MHTSMETHPEVAHHARHGARKQLAPAACPDLELHAEVVQPVALQGRPTRKSTYHHIKVL